MTVREAFKHSVNLVFIRLMRDVVHHHMSARRRMPAPSWTTTDRARREECSRALPTRKGSAVHHALLSQVPGQVAPSEAQELLLRGVRPTGATLASVFCSARARSGADALAQFSRGSCRGAGSPSRRCTRSTTARPRPLIACRPRLCRRRASARAVAGRLPARVTPAPRLTEVLAASRDERQEVYAWLFKTRHKGAQDVRIRNLIEQRRLRADPARVAAAGLSVRRR